MQLKEIEKWLRNRNEDELKELWKTSDEIRKSAVGDEVHLRGLIEISNYCSRSCLYCGIRSNRKNLNRYQMTEDEILSCAAQAVEFGYGTVVLQSGEDINQDTDFIAHIIRQIKLKTNLAITLSLGEKPEAIYSKWKKSGADRYLLRIESTDKVLLNYIHPGEPYGSRMESLIRLKKLGYEVGSGVMVGIPGQTFGILAKDIKWFKDFDLDMIGIGPYIAHPDTPLGETGNKIDDQTDSSELLANIAVALTRICCPTANIPATTALATINKTTGRENALNHGANVVMPNLTPAKYRSYYEIYPSKACVDETADICHHCIKERILSAGRTIGKGKGNRIKR